MDITKLRSRRVILPAITAAAALGIGGTAWTATASGDLRGSERDRVGTAASQAVGGTVTDIETSDDPGEAYEVELRADDGRQIDVHLDRDLNVVSQEAEDSSGDDTGDGDDAADTDERALTASERAAAEKAALAAVDGGTVLEVEPGDEGGKGYEAEVRDAGNTVWEVDIDASYRVVSKTVDD
jgi:uncharacterized membrane protein YkoI